MVKKYNPGDFFGELALLYNTPRAATIYAKSNDCVVWVLDRETFNNIVKDASIKKRNRNKCFLSSVEIFKGLNENEINQLVEAVKEEEVLNDEIIIKQGDIGNKFFLLEKGKAKAVKTFEDGVTEEVLDYKEGDYFGELAFIYNEPRAATVKTSSDCTFLTLDKECFKRLLGPIEKVLQKKSECYKKSSNKNSLV